MNYHDLTWRTIPQFRWFRVFLGTSNKNRQNKSGILEFPWCGTVIFIMEIHPNSRNGWILKVTKSNWKGKSSKFQTYIFWVQMLIFQAFFYMWFYDSMIFCDQFHVANRRICSSTIGDVEVVETSQRSGSRTLELLRSLDWWRRIGVGTLLQTNISHLWKRNIIDSQLPLKGDMWSFHGGYLVDIFSESIKDYLVFRCWKIQPQALA